MTGRKLLLPFSRGKEVRGVNSALVIHLHLLPVISWVRVSADSQGIPNLQDATGIKVGVGNSREMGKSRPVTAISS